MIRKITLVVAITVALGFASCGDDSTDDTEQAANSVGAVVVKTIKTQKHAVASINQAIKKTDSKTSDDVECCSP